MKKQLFTILTCVLIANYSNAQIHVVSTGTNSLTSTSAIGTNNIILGPSTVSTSSQDNMIIGNGAANLGAAKYNICLGNNAGAKLTTGIGNNYIGFNAGVYNTTGSNNSILGAWAGTNSAFNGSGNVLFGNNSGQGLTTGFNNVLVGNNSGQGLTTGSNNTLIGISTNASASVTNATAIGYNTIVSQSNSVIIGNNANVGIGTSTPNAKLHVVGDVVIGDGTLTINKPVGYSLYVQKGILTEKVKVAVVNSANWADYVFANNYVLQPLNDVENYISKNNHLPGIPSAEDLKNDGLDLGEMQAKQMAKIEELTLYMIELKKENEKLNNRLKLLETKN